MATQPTVFKWRKTEPSSFSTQALTPLYFQCCQPSKEGLFLSEKWGPPHLNHLDGLHHFDALGERFKCIDDGFVPLAERVTYRDSSNKKYACLHEVQRDVTDRVASFTKVMMLRVEVE